MNQDQIDFMRRMIIRYNSLTDEKEKEKLRNDIYIDILPYMKKWISSILSKKGIFLKEEEILSKSWDCFIFCIERFDANNKKIPFPKHFYKYTDYCLRSLDKNNKQEHLLDFTEYQNTIGIPSQNEIYNSIDELRCFRAMLEEDHAIIFDDALMSLVPANKNRQCRIKESHLPPLRYQEIKRIFKVIITFLVKK